MATKSASKVKEEQSEAAVQPADTEKTETPAANAQAAAEEEAHEEQTAAETQETSPDPEKDVEAGEPAVPEPAISKPAVPEPAVPELESISQLANRHRVPGWQLAALLRFMGWNDDKMIRDGEFRQALEDLKNRRMGGGRR